MTTATASSDNLTKLNQKLALICATYRDDPYGFVLAIFPWGESGTPLEKEDGPDEWQTEVLTAIRDGLITAAAAIQIAVASGHGVGKTALVAWIIIWFISTRPNPQIVVTANTKVQLETKTWRELSKWHKLALNKHWFDWTATKFKSKESPSTWFASAIPWSKENSEAFAGTHEKYVLMIFDEASNIPDKIWEVASGAMTTHGAIWIAFGNPTRNTGMFRQCFKKFRHRWFTKQVDSRTAKMADKGYAQRNIDDYGEDSDFVRVRVKGQFPRASSMQFISQELVDKAKAARHTVDVYRHASIVVGVDIARFGDDETSITVRQGLHVHEQTSYREIDTMQTASFTAQKEDAWRADAVFVECVLLGAGVVDRLVQLKRRPIPVKVGTKLKGKYSNKRAEIWGRMKEWLEAGGSIPDDDQKLEDDLTGIEYGFNEADQIQMEKVKDMKSRGLASPDRATSLALTFAEPVLPRQPDEDDYDYDDEHGAGSREYVDKTTGY